MIFCKKSCCIRIGRLPVAQIVLGLSRVEDISCIVSDERSQFGKKITTESSVAHWAQRVNLHMCSYFRML